MPNTNEQDFTELFKRVNEDVSALRSEVNRLTNIVKRLEAVAPTKADVAAAKRAQPDRAAKTAAVPKIAEEVKALNEEEAKAQARRATAVRNFLADMLGAADFDQAGRRLDRQACWEVQGCFQWRE